MGRQKRKTYKPCQQPAMFSMQPRCALRHQDVAAMVQLSCRTIAEMYDLGDRLLIVTEN